MAIYKYKGNEYADFMSFNDLLDLLLDVAKNEKEFRAERAGYYFTLDGEYIGDDEHSNYEDIIERLIDYGIEIEVIDDETN